MLAITNEPDSSPWNAVAENFQLLRGGNKIPFTDLHDVTSSVRTASRLASVTS